MWTIYNTNLKNRPKKLWQNPISLKPFIPIKTLSIFKIRK